MSYIDAIAEADKCLAGEDAGEHWQRAGLDPQWQAVIEVGMYLEEQPAAVWQFVQRWAISPADDIRAAIACVLLEHLLEQDFEFFYPRVKRAVTDNALFADTFSHCWVSIPKSSRDKAEEFVALQEACRGRIDEAH